MKKLQDELLLNKVGRDLERRGLEGESLEGRGPEGRGLQGRTREKEQVWRLELAGVGGAVPLGTF